MFRDGVALRFSPTDLTIFLDGEFGSWMDHWHANGSADGSASARGAAARTSAAAPHACVPTCCPDEDDPELSLIARKGDEHEQHFLNSLKHADLDVVEISRGDDAFDRTMACMRSGAAIIYQGHLRHSNWAGYTDFLSRLEGESALGKHHYEVWDTKLARSPKPYFLIQLAAYAELLEHIQGRRPKHVEVILGNNTRHRFTTDNFFYYYRELKRAFENFHKLFDPAKPPHPGFSNSYGRWSNYAEQILQASDDLCCVARITRSQARKLRDASIETMLDLAKHPDTYISGVTAEVLGRLKRQSQLQLSSRGKATPDYEVVTPLPSGPGRGLALLPQRSPNDVFFDMEGYPLIDGGLEYLFGLVCEESGEIEFYDWWAHDQLQEKAAFEGFIDWVFGRWSNDRTMHIYHYAAYEVSAMRRLMGKYATREHEVDELLRNEVFLDLYTIVRQGLLVGTSSYSLKDVEKLYLPRQRDGGVKTAGGSVVAYQKWLDCRDGETWQDSKALCEIRDYNQVDCESTLQLRDWLLKRRDENGITPFARASDDDQGKSDDEVRLEKPAKLLSNQLLAQLAAGAVADPERQRVQELLAWLLEFHWREAKPVFWRMFDRHEMTEEELIDDVDCLGGVQRTEKPKYAIKKSWGYEYKFDPDQDTKLHEGSACYHAHDLAQKCTIVSFDPDEGRVTIKLGPKSPAPPDRLNLIPDEYVSAERIAAAVYRYVVSWSNGEQVSRAVDDLLHRRPPRIKDHTGGPLVPQASKLEGIVDVATRLNQSTVCIQGPPGTGKTHTAAAIIAALVKRGKSVGITATSHKAILNAMHAVAEAMDREGVKGQLLKVGNDDEDPLIAAGRIRLTDSNTAAGQLATGVVIGGTAWLFSRDDFVGQLDYLVVDEAGQFCLANVVATGQSAKNIILVGDQMQLSQPIQGSHPGESGMSGLEYLLQGKATVPPEFGIFLDTTWRMHPHICRFISDAVYEGRLHSIAGTEGQEVRCGNGRGEQFKRTCGIVFVETPHQFNSQCSEEEVDEIEKIVAELMGRCVVGRDGDTHALTLGDILIVAPYNMQVRKLKSRLGAQARVGSVDKFQGQEAPVVIVSMCASSVEDVPRGIGFILNKNRINVAVSRAKCLAIVVGCRGLMAARCTTIEQMEMTNLYCWLAEHANQPVA